MKILVKTALFTALVSLPAIASSSPIKFNYKNLNTIGSMVCEVTGPKSTKGIALVHNLSINKKKYGAGKFDESYEISGTCNSKFSLKSKKLISLGDEINLDINLASLKDSHGTVGINEVKLIFKHGKLTEILNIDPLGLSLSSRRNKLKMQKWAKTNAAFSLDKKTDIRVILGTSKIKEVSSNLYLFNKNYKSKWSKIWHYQTKGCSVPRSVKIINCSLFKI